MSYGLGYEDYFRALNEEFYKRSFCFADLHITSLTVPETGGVCGVYCEECKRTVIQWDPFLETPPVSTEPKELLLLRVSCDLHFMLHIRPLPPPVFLEVKP